MIKTNSKVILFIAAIALVGLTIFSVSQASAQTPANPVSSLVQKLAQRFNLKETDVQSVFDQAKTDRYEARLTQLVKDGKLTEVQKQAILAKHKELQAWAKQNGLEGYDLGGFGKFGMGMHHRRGF